LWLQALRSAGSLSSSGRTSSLLSLSRNSTTTLSEIIHNPTNTIAVSTTPKNVRGLLRGVDGPLGSLVPRRGRPRVGRESAAANTNSSQKNERQRYAVSCVLRRVKFLLYCLQPRADDAARRRQGNARAATELAAIHALKRRRALELARATSPQRLGTPRRAARRRDAVVTPSGRLAF